MLGLLTTEPLSWLTLGGGAAYRAPLYNPETYWSPVAWRSDAPEWNLIYRAQFNVLRRSDVAAAFSIGNLSGLRFYNPHHIAFHPDGAVALSPGWHLTGHAGTAFKGLSSLLLSFGEFDINLGVTRGI